MGAEEEGKGASTESTALQKTGGSQEGPPVVIPLVPAGITIEDDVRSKLATGLAFIFAGTIGLIFLVIFLSKALGLDSEMLRDLVSVLISAETGLFGTVLGFYFGGQTRR